MSLQSSTKRAASKTAKSDDSQFIGQYSKLWAVFQECIDEMAEGKGHSRHGNHRCIENQGVAERRRAFGPGFTLGQAAKKLEESPRLAGIAKKRELIGAINYIAIEVMMMKEMGEDK